MARELRRVPLDWEHPKNNEGEYIPLCDLDVETARLTLPPGVEEEFSEEGYRQRKWTEEEAVGYQLYEDCSKGTPLSPVFETTNDLIAYLKNEGDFWGNKWSKESTELLIKNGWAASFVFTNGRFLRPHEHAEALKEE